MRGVQVAGDHTRGERRPGLKARCELLYTAQNMRNPGSFFTVRVSIALLGSGSAEKDPAEKASSPRL